MSEVFTYIATKSTVDPYIPVATPNLTIFARNVSDGFQALTGGRTVVGQLVQFPLQRSVPNHLLCDGRDVAKASFPELFDYLGTSQGTPADPLMFRLPDYIGAIVAATTSTTETTVGGTVSTEEPIGTPDSEYPVYGDVDSGGRYRRLSSTEELP